MARATVRKLRKLASKPKLLREIVAELESSLPRALRRFGPLRGEEVASILDVEEEAAWKALRVLERRGFLRNTPSGYELSEDALRGWTAEEAFRTAETAFNEACARVGLESTRTFYFFATFQRYGNRETNALFRLWLAMDEAVRLRRQELYRRRGRYSPNVR